MFGLDGKVAIVTGGNRGIGKAIAKGLAGAGANIVIGDIAFEDGNEAQSATVTEIGEEFGVKALGLKSMCAAGGRQRKSGRTGAPGLRPDRHPRVQRGKGGGRVMPQNIPLTTWDDVMATNLRSFFMGAKAATSPWRGGGGKIVSIGSMTSLFGVGAFPLTPRARGAFSS